MYCQIPPFARLTMLCGAILLDGCSLFGPTPESDTKTAKLAATPPQSKVEVMITPKMPQAEVKHNGTPVTIKRVQDEDHWINNDFAKTSRKCPPFCIKPFHLKQGVATIGELEVIDYAVKMSNGDHSVILVDARSPEWLALGTIPGAVNIPYSRLSRAKGAIEVDITTSMKQLGVKKTAKGWDFHKAKTVVLFSNGAWGNQSFAAAKGLLKEGYPSKKIKWYRGGMQSWQILGLSTVKP